MRRVPCIPRKVVHPKDEIYLNWTIRGKSTYRQYVSAVSADRKTRLTFSTVEQAKAFIAKQEGLI